MRILAYNFFSFPVDGCDFTFYLATILFPLYTFYIIIYYYSCLSYGNARDVLTYFSGLKNYILI